MLKMLTGVQRTQCITYNQKRNWVFEIGSSVMVHFPSWQKYRTETCYINYRNLRLDHIGHKLASL